MTPTAARRVAHEVWFPHMARRGTHALPPPSDDRPPAEKAAAAEARRIALEVWFPHWPVEKACPQPTPKQTRVRKPTLSHALKEADRAGRQVKGAAIYADRVEITFGEPEPSPADADINEWDADLGPLPPPLRQ